ncbi:hypothetical protein DFH07DRAFT_766351 [Mycena maculata]|uniref:Uncharacterized protein n=1 Tax=Mycena maculata TaxID=230809 RepID=A0AAD7NW94_9AGAR|nr:hypothetical protein DFH07DRAFT_766351 [Mycena maculata]
MVRETSKNPDPIQSIYVTSIHVHPWITLEARLIMNEWRSPTTFNFTRRNSVYTMPKSNPDSENGTGLRHCSLDSGKLADLHRATCLNLWSTASPSPRADDQGYHRRRYAPTCPTTSPALPTAPAAGVTVTKGTGSLCPLQRRPTSAAQRPGTVVLHTLNHGLVWHLFESPAESAVAAGKSSTPNRPEAMAIFQEIVHNPA